MQAHAHHLRVGFTLFIQRIEGVFKIIQELVPRIESLGCGKTHVIDVQCIGDDEMRRLEVHTPVRQVIGIGIAVVEEAAKFIDQLARVGAVSTGVPATWSLVRYTGVLFNRLVQGLRFGTFGE